MDFINPLSTSILQSTQLQVQLSAEKNRQVRKTQALSKDVATQDDEMEHQVESAEELAAIRDEEPGHHESKKPKDDGRQPPEEEQTHLDLTA